MNTKYIKWYSLIVGSLIIVSWIFILIYEELPEGKIELFCHICSEFIMALLCLFGGYSLIKKKLRGLLFCLTGFSMIVYSTLNAIGYYWGSCNFSMIIMLFTIFIINSIFFIITIRVLIGVKYY